MTTAPAPLPYVVMVDDEEDLREPTAAYLRDQGIEIDEADGGASLDLLLEQRQPALLLLDVTMPGEDGFSIARRVRAAHPRIGIVMLTARRDVIDRVVGLELGADDYIMKPFEPRELLARIRSVLRRLAMASAAAAAADLIAVPDRDDRDPDDTAELPVAGAYHEEFWIPTSRGQVRVPVDTIEWIEAAKDYALLHTPERSHMIRVTMAALEAGLDPNKILRVHRSAFVRPEAVRRISAIGRHLTLELKSGAAVRVGPRHWGEIRHRLKV